MDRTSTSTRSLGGLAVLLLVWALVVPSLHVDHVDRTEAHSHDCAYCHPAQSGSLLVVELDAPIVDPGCVTVVDPTDAFVPAGDPPRAVLARGPPAQV